VDEVEGVGQVTPKQRAIIREMFGGRCAYCGIELPEKGWHADHVEPIVRQSKWVPGPHGLGKFVKTGKCDRPDNERADNYFPSCAKCNIEKRDSSIEIFRRGLERKIGTLRDYSAAFRHAERYGMVTVVKEKITFYFETLGDAAVEEPQVVATTRISA
jgi:hypothetical protein